jgi:hypothetical protein
LQGVRQNSWINSCKKRIAKQTLQKEVFKMKCIDSGTIQALIDGELEISVKKGVEKHIADCDKCSKAYDSLKRNDDFAFGKLTAYRQFCEENYIQDIKKCDAMPLDNRKHSGKKPDAGELLMKKEVKGFMFKYRKIAAAVCIAATVTLCAAVQPVRAFISEALSIFRVESVKGFRVSLADMEEIRQKLEQKEGEIDIDSIGKIKREGFRTSKVSASEAKAAAGFPVLLPPDEKDSNIEITASQPGQISFTMKVYNVNEALKSFGSTRLLPENLDGKMFTADFAYQVNYSYYVSGDSYYMTQTRSPELAVPADVNIDEIYDCLVELPILPGDMQRQLKSIRDWKNTIYLPVVDAEPQEVDINGAKGFIAEKKNGGCMLVWYNEGTICSMDSRAGRDDILRLARSMR